MNIEEKIDNLITQIDTFGSYHILPIRSWRWSTETIEWAKDLVDTPEEEKTLYQFLGRLECLEYEVIQLIKESNDLECLTSSATYVRKTKEWFINERKIASN